MLGAAHYAVNEFTGEIRPWRSENNRWINRMRLQYAKSVRRTPAAAMSPFKFAAPLRPVIVQINDPAAVFAEPGPGIG